jgi:hypothetical protein
MENITKLITVNLNTINIGNLDIPTFYAIAEKITSEEFLNESKLMNVKIILKENIYKYDENMKKHKKVPDVSLPNKNPSMMDRLSHARFEHKSLKTALKKVLNSKSQNIIELVLSFIKKTMLKHSP